MKVEIIPLNVNWAIIQLLPAGSLCVHQWMVWWIVDTGGWIKLNPSVSHRARRDSAPVDRFIIIGASHFDSFSFVLNPPSK